MHNMLQNTANNTMKPTVPVQVNAAEQLATARGEDVLYLCCVLELRTLYAALDGRRSSRMLAGNRHAFFEKVDDAESSGSVVDARFATAILNVMTLFEVALALLLRLSWGSRAAIQRGKVLQRRSRGEVNPEPIPPALIASRHLGRHMSELLLRIELVNLSRGGEAGSN